MAMSETSGGRVRALAAVACLSLIACAANADEPPRINTFVHPYAGGAEQFEKFSNLARFQLGTLGEQLDQLAPGEGLDALTFKLVSAAPPDSNEKFDAAWKSPQTLQIWSGNVEIENDQVAIVTFAYLGEVLGKLATPRVDLEQELSRRQNRNVKNSHMAITAYALAMDLQNNGKPASTVLRILNEAQERAGELDTEVAGHRALQEAIAASIAELRN